MPVLATGYIYAFVALLTVSSILISSFSAYAATLRTIPEIEQLRNVLEHVATKGYELAALTAKTNSTSQAVLRLPSAIGAKQYWIGLRGDLSKTWVEGALGPIRRGNVNNRVYLPNPISAIGNYSSSRGPAVLECRMNGSTIILDLRTWRTNP